jgi:hypothetical protein
MLQSKKKLQNYLTMIPVHNVQEFNETEGKITLVIPKFKHSWIRKTLVPKRKSTHFRIHLDESGSHIWRLVNGQRTVEQICSELNQILISEGKTTETIEERVTIFMTDLYKKKFIVFEQE